MSLDHVVGSNSAELQEKDMDELAQLNALHGVVAEAVNIHHMMGLPALPAKDRLLDWTLGDAVQPLRAKCGADYALFFRVRDSYATAERKAAMVGMMILGAAASRFETMYTVYGWQAKVTRIEPGDFAGEKGVRFELAMTKKGSGLQMKGVGWAAVRNGELYAATFTAPELSFFQRLLPKAEALVASARIRS